MFRHMIDYRDIVLEAGRVNYPTWLTERSLSPEGINECPSRVW